MDKTTGPNMCWLAHMRSRVSSSSTELTQTELSGQELAESNKLNTNGTNSKGKLFIPAL